jgi:hypothetical protein
MPESVERSWQEVREWDALRNLFTPVPVVDARRM